MTVAIARHVPPSNPFFANASAPLRYHYLWLLFCSLPMKVFHLSPRYVVYSGVVWCGLGLMCTIALGLKFLLRVQTQIEQKTLLGVGLALCHRPGYLAGPLLGIAQHVWLAIWSGGTSVQITSWAGLHAVGAAPRRCVDRMFRWILAAATSGRRAPRMGHRPVIVAGMAFASAAGMSVYVTFTFVIAVALWLLVLIARKGWIEAAMFASAGGGTAVGACPIFPAFAVPPAVLLLWNSRCDRFPGTLFRPTNRYPFPTPIRVGTSPTRSSCPSTMLWNSDSFSPSAFCGCGKSCVAESRPAPTNWLHGRWSAPVS
jgi:hypothetical protein